MVAIAASLVALTNLPIMIIDGGMSKRMSLLHLLIWGPLEYLLIARLTELGGPSSPSVLEWRLALVIVLVNGISLAFDVLESWRWLKGDRTIPMH